MGSELMAANPAANVMESVVIAGDLSKLTPTQRVQYYQATCKSLGLNPLTRPFDYITLNGKLTLYAKKDAADQLRKVHEVSIDKPEITFQDNLIIVTVTGTDKTGRHDSEIGVVNKGDMRGDVANALMKAVTKAKRRLTLSICGLGWLDETEVETIPDARPVAAEVVEADASLPGNGHPADADFTSIPSARQERQQNSPDPAQMTSKAALIAWSLDIVHAFDHPNHAHNAWDVMVKEQKPATFADQRREWIADVERRVSERQLAPKLIDEEVPA